MPSQEKPPNDLDLLMARAAHRKVERVVQATMAAFFAAIEQEGTLSADEIVAVGINLIMNVMVAPMEKMSAKPREMRIELARQVRLMIERGTARSEDLT